MTPAVKCIADRLHAVLGDNHTHISGIEPQCVGLAYEAYDALLAGEFIPDTNPDAT